MRDQATISLGASAKTAPRRTSFRTRHRAKAVEPSLLVTAPYDSLALRSGCRDADRADAPQVAASSPSISPSSAASAMAVSSSPSPSPDPSSSSSASTAPSTSILGLPRPSSTFLPRPCRRNCPHPPSRRLSRLSPKVNIPTGSYGFASEVVDALAWTKQQHGERDERSRDGDGRRGKGLVGCVPRPFYDSASA